jgi:hypothetical protein
VVDNGVVHAAPQASVIGSGAVGALVVMCSLP